MGNSDFSKPNYDDQNPKIFREQIESQPNESLRQFLLDELEDGVWDWNIQTNEMSCSRQLANLLGCGEHDLVDSINGWESRFHPDDKAYCYAILNQHFNGEIPVYKTEHRIRCNDGSYKWILDRGKVIERTKDGKPLRMIGVRSDITDLKQAENRVKEQAAILDGFYNSAPMMMGVVELSDRDILHISDNQATGDFFNMTADALSGRWASELGVPEENIIELWIQNYRASQQQQQSVKFEYAHVKESVTSWLSVTVTFIDIADSHRPRFSYIANDISDRKKLELELESAKQQLEQVLQASSEGYWDWNRVSEEFYISPTGKAMLGYADHELDNNVEVWKSLIFEEDRANASQIERDCSIGKVDRFSINLRYHHKNGSIVHVLCSAINQKDSQGNVVRMVGSHLDVTQLVEMQEALKTSKMLLSNVLDNSLDGIMAFRSVRDEEDRIIDFEWLLSNPAACTMVGRSEADLIGKRLLIEMPGNRDEGLFDSYVQVVRSGEPFQHEFYYCHDRIDSWFENFAVKLGDGFAVTFRNITAIKQAENALKLANQQLTERIEDLRQRNAEMQILSEISDFLQSCVTVQEACTAVASMVLPLFPDCSGGIFIINPSHDEVKNAASWGVGMHSKNDFLPSDCWALRRGQLHLVGQERVGLRCSHIHADEAIATTLCISMIAQGETIGLFYLNTNGAETLSRVKQQLAKTLAEQVSLAIANLNLRETLQYQSIRDPLTGLFNRRYLEESLVKEISRAQRHQHVIGIAMIDIDHFKKFNDTFGHDAGDYVLQNVGDLLKQSIRGSDIACRYGGEELTLIFPESSLQETAIRAEMIREAIAQLKLAHNGHLLGNLTASIGVAAFPEHGTTGDAVMQSADAALYRAKKSGRDRVMVAP